MRSPDARLIIRNGRSCSLQLQRHRHTSSLHHVHIDSATRNFLKSDPGSGRSHLPVHKNEPLVENPLHFNDSTYKKCLKLIAQKKTPEIIPLIEQAHQPLSISHIFSLMERCHPPHSPCFYNYVQYRIFHLYRNAIDPARLTRDQLDKLLRLCYLFQDFDQYDRLFSFYLKSENLDIRLVNYALNVYLKTGNVELAKQLLYQMAYSENNYRSSILENFLARCLKLDVTVQAMVFAYNTFLQKKVPVTSRCNNLMMSGIRKSGSREYLDWFEKLMASTGANQDPTYKVSRLLSEMGSSKESLLEKVKNGADLLKERNGFNYNVQDHMTYFFTRVIKLVVSKYDMEMALKVMQIMGDNKVAPAVELPYILASYYVRTKDLPGLLTFLQNLFHSGTLFNYKYISIVWNCFLSSHPHLAREFHCKLLDFVTKHKSLNMDWVRFLQSYLVLVKHDVKNPKKARQHTKKSILKQKYQYPLRIPSGETVAEPVPLLQIDLQPSEKYSRILDNLFSSDYVPSKALLNFLVESLDPLKDVTLLNKIEETRVKLRYSPLAKFKLTPLKQELDMIDKTYKTKGNKTSLKSLKVQEYINTHFHTLDANSQIQLARICISIKRFDMADMILKANVHRSLIYYHTLFRLSLFSRDYKRLIALVEKIDLDKSLEMTPWFLMLFKDDLKTFSKEFSGLDSDERILLSKINRFVVKRLDAWSLRLESQDKSVNEKVDELFGLFDRWIAESEKKSFARQPRKQISELDI